jgi:hypothetical protein
MGALVFCAIGFVSLILAVFAYQSRENNDSAEVKRILGDVVEEVQKSSDGVKEFDLKLVDFEAATNKNFKALTERVYELENKPLPAPIEPPPTPVINFPTEIFVKTRRPIAVDVISVPKRQPSKDTADKNKKTSGAFLSQPKANGDALSNLDKRREALTRKSLTKPDLKKRKAK